MTKQEHHRSSCAIASRALLVASVALMIGCGWHPVGRGIADVFQSPKRPPAPSSAPAPAPVAATLPIVEQPPAFVTTWGEAGSGNSQFRKPKGIAVDDASGIVYVADTGNHRLQKFTADGQWLAAWGDSGSASGQFRFPAGVTVDLPTGHVYVADYGNDRVQAFTASGECLFEWKTPGPCKFARFEWVDKFNRLDDGRIDSGHLYVASRGADRVTQFNSIGEYIREWSVERSPATPPAPRLLGIAVRRLATLSMYVNTTVFVADCDGNRVIGYGDDGSHPFEFGNRGVEFLCPRDVAVDDQMNLYVTDAGNGRIQKFDHSGVFLSVWGTPGRGNREFANPSAIAVDSEGGIYVMDTDNDRVQKFKYPTLPATRVGVSGETFFRWVQLDSGGGRTIER